MEVELFKGKGIQPWYLRVIAANGKTLATSEGYFSKWNAKRAARKTFPTLSKVEVTESGKVPFK